jgi:hypothetical protein
MTVANPSPNNPEGRECFEAKCPRAAKSATWLNADRCGDLIWKTPRLVRPRGAWAEATASPQQAFLAEHFGTEPDNDWLPRYPIATTQSSAGLLSLHSFEKTYSAIGQN